MKHETMVATGTEGSMHATRHDDPIVGDAVNAIRFLAIDMVEAAGCGHPGAPMGMATMAYSLWTRHLRHNPESPAWPDRDRVVLSNGHASALLYAMLHLTGYDLPLDELKRFRQLESRTPGHPEYGLTPGVETTTGPLGQGFTNAVGMAMAEAWLAARANRDDRLVDHHTYVFCSDGDLQEGITSEAASLAGHHRLGKLVALYDDNGIQIEGSTGTNFTEDVPARFGAYGWHVVGPIDGHDLAAVDRAIEEAKAETDRPTLVVCKTHIGYGSPGKVDSEASHGAALGADEVAATRDNLGWSHPPFVVPQEVVAHFRACVARGRALEADWTGRLSAARGKDPARVQDLERLLGGELPDGWDAPLDDLFADAGDMPTRKASGTALNALAATLPSLIGGSADLGPSNNTEIKGGGWFGPDERTGRNLHFGVREHAMAAIASGMSLHGGIVPYTGTFLTFSDYMRPSIRLASLMGIRAIYVFTHDSIGLGEDGPTHQPIEHLAALRAIPGLTVIRPGDAAETGEAWRMAVANRTGPTAIVLTRQTVTTLDRTEMAAADGVRYGGYVLRDAGGAPDLILIGTGSELGLVVDAQTELAKLGVGTRVVSLPSWEVFLAQDARYRDQVLPPSLPRRLAVEAAVPFGWERFVGTTGVMMGVSTFGVSAPYQHAYAHFGLTVDAIVSRALSLLEKGDA